MIAHYKPIAALFAGLFTVLATPGMGQIGPGDSDDLCAPPPGATPGGANVMVIDERLDAYRTILCPDDPEDNDDDPPKPRFGGGQLSTGPVYGDFPLPSLGSGEALPTFENLDRLPENVEIE